MQHQQCPFEWGRRITLAIRDTEPSQQNSNHLYLNTAVIHKAIPMSKSLELNIWTLCSIVYELHLNINDMIIYVHDVWHYHSYSFHIPRYKTTRKTWVKIRFLHTESILWFLMLCFGTFLKPSQHKWSFYFRMEHSKTLNKCLHSVSLTFSF